MNCRRGQAILESLIVLLVLLAATFFFFDFTYGIVAQLHLNNAAARTVRADTVGFNSFHERKAANVAMIPVAGKRVVPESDRTVTAGSGELALARTYLQSETPAEANGILHYQRWNTLSIDIERKNDLTKAVLSFEVPRSMPGRLGALFGSTLTDDGTRKLKAMWEMEDHASYYLEATSK